MNHRITVVGVGRGLSGPVVLSQGHLALPSTVSMQMLNISWEGDSITSKFHFHKFQMTLPFLSLVAVHTVHASKVHRAQQVPIAAGNTTIPLPS